MFELTIPGKGLFQLSDLMLDFNGTLALDGKLINGVSERLVILTNQFKLHVVTGDTHGTAKNQLVNTNCQLTVVPPENQTSAKIEYLNNLDPQHVVAIGNGYNDHQIVKLAKIGIIVIGEEGAATKSISDADIVVTHILNALDLLIHSTRLVATLRS